MLRKAGMAVDCSSSRNRESVTKILTQDVACGGADLVDPEDVSSIRAGFLRLINSRHYVSKLIDVGLENVKKYRPDATARQYRGRRINAPWRI